MSIHRWARRWMWRLVGLTTVLALLGGWLDHRAITARGTTPGVVTVVSITDGDTFRASTGAVRIDNIEAPDSKAHPTRRTPECVDPQGAAAATAALAQLLPIGAVVELQKTGTSYDRTVALVTIDGQDVGQLMLATGLVDTYPATGGPCPGGDR